MQEQGSDNNIWVYDLIRNVPTKFTFDPANEVWPIWSLDGESIYYAANRNNNYEIFQKNISGLDEAKLVYGNDSGDVGPNSFTPDGQKLLFTISRTTRNIGILYPAKLSLKREEQIETFPDKQKLKRLVTSRSTL